MQDRKPIEETKESVLKRRLNPIRHLAFFRRNWITTSVCTALLIFVLIPPPAPEGMSYGQEGRRGGRNQDGPPTRGLFGMFGKPGGPGGPKADLELVSKFDKNNNGWLEDSERKEARIEAKKKAPRKKGRWGGRGPKDGNESRVEKNQVSSEKLSPSNVKTFPDRSLYDSEVLRTVFIEFPNNKWEEELEDFKHTDVEVPATVTVDKKTYEKVGIKFRGNSSYMRVPRGQKRSLNLSFHMADKDQRIGGYRTLNLLNGVGDSSYLSSVLYAHIASPYIAVPKANLVKVVINGEYWGVYSNVQQINKDFTKENYAIGKGTRWKVPGRPGADGGLRYLGENTSAYKSRYEIKTKEKPEAWQALKELCKILHETAPEDLPSALEGKLDVDGVLKFLAVDMAVVNSDGYWTRASDYCLFMDTSGKFHVIPYDMNESFMTGGRGPGGPGGRKGKGRRGPGFDGPEGRGDRPERREADGKGRRNRGEKWRGRGEGGQGPGGRPPMFGFGGGPGRGFGGPGGHGSLDLDPLVSINDPKKPLHSKLLAVPEYRKQYLSYVKRIAQDQMKESNIGRFVAMNRSLISSAVKLETRSSVSHQRFLTSAGTDESKEGSLSHFFMKRRSYLLNHPEIKTISITNSLEKRARIKQPSKSLKSNSSSRTSKIRISEVMAANSRTVPNPEGKFEDWIEIVNLGKETVDLNGYFLSDKKNELEKWKFPNGTKVLAGQHLVIWADESSGKGLHANFKLKKKGEAIYLVRRQNASRGSVLQIVDSVQFGKQTDGVSWGKIEGKWQSLVPSPGEKNKISEVEN